MGLDVEMKTVVELAAAAPSPLIRKSGRGLSLSLPVCVFSSLVLLRWCCWPLQHWKTDRHPALYLQQLS